MSETLPATLIKEQGGKENHNDRADYESIEERGGSDGKAYLGRSLKRRIRALIHQLDILTQPQRVSLAGLISYAFGVDPQFGTSLIEKYGLERVRKAKNPLA